MSGKIWAKASYVLSLCCLAVMTWKYGLMAALLGYIACAFMSASMILAFGGGEDEEDDVEGNGKESSEE